MSRHLMDNKRHIRDLGCKSLLFLWDLLFSNDLVTKHCRYLAFGGLKIVWDRQ